MKRQTIKEMAFMTLLLMAALVAFGFAGQCDFEDAAVTEMKNNGAYWRMSAEHPDWSDSRLVEVYLEERDANK